MLYLFVRTGALFAEIEGGGYTKKDTMENHSILFDMCGGLPLLFGGYFMKKRFQIGKGLGRCPAF